MVMKSTDAFKHLRVYYIISHIISYHISYYIILYYIILYYIILYYIILYYIIYRAFRNVPWDYKKDPPTDKTIRAWYKQSAGTVCLCKQKSSGRPLTAEDDVERVRASFLHSPKKSTTGTAAKELSISKTTVRRILRKRLPRDLANLKARIIAAVKDIDAPLSTRVGARTGISYRCMQCHPCCTHRTSMVVKKKTLPVFLWL